MTTLNDIQACAEKTFHINTLKPYQTLVIYGIVEQFERKTADNRIVILPTGSGKSLCFLLPAVMSNGITVIVYPLLALMNDQTEKLQKLGIDCVNLRGSQTEAERNEVFKKLRNGTKIIITNPETLKQPGILKKLKQFKIEMFTVDEAHVISQWGKEFRPAYLNLKEITQYLCPHQILAFTATAAKQTLNDIKACLFSSDPIVVNADADRENIFYSSYPVLSKTQGLIELLQSCTLPAIVFCYSRETTYHLCLAVKNLYPTIDMQYYHAGLSKDERNSIEEWFRKSNNGLLFTTCAYGLGVDIPGIRTVIHYDLPDDALEYLQESGRAGRDGKPASAYVLVPEDSNNEGLISIFTGDECRRKALLASLGEEKDECSGCDVCTKSVIKHPYGYREIESLIKLYPFKFSSASAAGLLCASPFYHKYEQHPFYGLLDMDYLLLKESIERMNFKTVINKNKVPLLYTDNFINRLIAKIKKRTP